MAKALLIISENTLIESIAKSIDEKKESLDQTLSFIKKQADSAIRHYYEDIKEDWTILENFLKEKGKLPPDYNDEKFTIRFNSEKDVIELITKEEEEEERIPLPVRMLFQAMKKEKDD